MWAAAAQVGMEMFKEDQKGAAALTGNARSFGYGARAMDGSNWTVNFGEKPLNLNALPPWVMGAGLVVAGIVAIAAVRIFRK